MPMSLVAAFWLKWEVLGLWTGLAVTLYLIAGLQILVILLCTNWSTVWQEAMARLASDPPETDIAA